MVRLLPSFLIQMVIALVLTASAASAQTGSVSGTVRDDSGGVLPGVVVQVAQPGVPAVRTDTDGQGAYAIGGLRPGPATVSFLLINFAANRREVTIAAAQTAKVDAVMQLSLSADVTVTGKATFTNLADAANPAENLVGIAQSASQGAITARQLEARPVMRSGEVLETVPGVVISQHSGEGKANQYYLRGFNLDHGTDFATSVVGIPVNLPTHAHGHGYSDLNFLIPELISGVQFSKGPYFAEQGDFATAGAANINYTNSLGRPIVRITGGGQGYRRALAAASTRGLGGTWLGAIDVSHNDGPWIRKDDFRKVNGLVRFTRGDAQNGLALTAMGYRATWNATDQVPMRAVESGLLDRMGTIDTTDGGGSYRYSGSAEWQRTKNNASTKVSAYGLAYDLSLYSNFTYFLNDPVNGDQFQQADHRFVSGAKVTHRRMETWGGHSVQNTFAVSLRNDDIGNLGLYHTVKRERLATIREDAVMQTSAGAYVQNETEWAPWLRSLSGLRVDGYRFDVKAGVPENSGVATAGIVSPKLGVAIGPFSGTELYANAGLGFHSNDARGATIRVDPTTGEPAERVTPLARATGAEVGVRTVRIPHLQSSLSLWSLQLDSELIFIGDAGTTEAGRPSHRYGIEWANYYAPVTWLIVDADVSTSQAKFTDGSSADNRVPGAVNLVMSGGITLENIKRVTSSVRWRYFGPRALVEDNSSRSKATSLFNLEAGYRISTGVRLNLDVFNLLNVSQSDVDYFYTSRLRGEPLAGVDDIHFHPTLPRTARLNLVVDF